MDNNGGYSIVKKARFKNFTITPNDTWKFCDGINIIIGENGLGKTHILKSIYSLIKVQSDKHGDLTKSSLEKSYADKIVAVMRSETLGRLVKRKQGRARCEMALSFSDEDFNCSINFSTNAKSSVEGQVFPKKTLSLSPVYIPTRELITLAPWFVALYDNYHLEFEETWRDTVSLLGAPTVKGPRERTVSALLEPLEEAIGGKVVIDPKTARFYLQIPGEGRMEMPLVAEGLRKIAMIARLISSGVLLKHGYLFWDEPESNLNPKLIKVVASILWTLAQHGIQIFCATHSLFMLRELEIISQKEKKKKNKLRYFGLTQTNNGIILSQDDNLEGIGDFSSLDESLKQSDRYLEI